MSEKFPTNIPEESLENKGISRRDFLKKSLRGLAGAVLASQLPTEVFGQEKNKQLSEIKKYPEVKNIIEAENFCVDLLAKNQGIFYGETHDSNPGNEQFMIESLEKFKQAGVRVIAMEAIDSEDQNLIDDYFNNPNKSKDALLNCTEDKLGRFPLIEASMKAGIKIIGIDMKARHVGQPGWEKIKSEEVDEWWANQVKKEMENRSQNEKYIVYGGFYHSKEDGTGVNNLLKIPSIIPINPNDYQKPFFALEAGTKIIPGNPKGADYQRVYFESFDKFCEYSINYYKKNSLEISNLYGELKKLISNYLESKNFNLKKEICKKVDSLFPIVEEYDKEYLIQIKKVFTEKNNKE